MERFTVTTGFPSHGHGSRMGDPGDLAGRLVALFGEPTYLGEGPGWTLLDHANGVRLYIEVNIAGLSFAVVDSEQSLDASTEALNALIDATVPVDCVVTLPGYVEVGVTEGRSFERSLPKPPRPDPLLVARSVANGSTTPTEAWDALLQLHDAYPGQHLELAATLWRKAAKRLVEDLEGELARPRPDRTSLRSASMVHTGLRSAAKCAGLDADAEFAPHAALLARAERVLERQRR